MIRELRARPLEFRHERSAARTVAAVALAAIGAAWLVWFALAPDAVLAFLHYEGHNPRWAARAFAAPGLSVLLAVALVVGGAIGAIRRAGPWVHVPTGARLHRMRTLVYAGDPQLADRIAADLTTTEPAQLLPMRPPQGRGTIVVELWESADEVWASVSGTSEGGRLIRLDPAVGAAVRAAAKAGRLAAASDVSPLAPKKGNPS